MQRENKWQERFDEKYDIQNDEWNDEMGIPSPHNIKFFIQSEIDTAIAEERSRIAKWADDNTGAGGDTCFFDLICCIADEKDDDVAFKKLLNR